MFRISSCFHSFFLNAVRCTFIADVLYGCRYSPHIGMCHHPYVYVKTVLFCVSSRPEQRLEREYMRGLIEHLVACDAKHDTQTKLELMRFVDVVPAAASLGGSGHSEVLSAGKMGGESGMSSFFTGTLFPAVLGHVLLYDAVCVCMSGGLYDDAARDCVAQVAARLGVSQHGREMIEKAAIREHQLAAMKRQLLLLPETPPLR